MSYESIVKNNYHCSRQILSTYSLTSERIEQINGLNEEMRAIEVQKRSLKDERPLFGVLSFEIFRSRHFDIIIGNPPYLRQRRHDPNGVLETSAYKDALLEMLRSITLIISAKSPYERHEFKTGRNQVVD